MENSPEPPRFNLWSCLTQDLPGIGGKIRQCREDFFVEEVPLYTPCGEGTHLYLRIEKKGTSTFEAVGQLAKALGRKTGEFGYAGLKDSDAVTRQYISIEHVSKETVESLDLEKIKILEATFHQNKLKTGHLRGNRFKILIRDPVPDALEKARPIVERLQEQGMPNFYGPQRFGLFGNTHLLGGAILKKDFKGFADILVCTPRTEKDIEYNEVIACYREGDYEGACARLGRRYKYESRLLRSLARRPGRFDKAVTSLDKKMLQFYFSAFQSDLFNRYLMRRLSQIHSIEEGEIAYLHRNGASFMVDSPEKELPRVQSFEISPSGPVFGSKMLRARGVPGQIEAELLKESGFELEELKGMFGIRLRGARRPLRVPMDECTLEEKGEGLLLTFFLPLGSYATVILHEIMKDENNRLTCE